MDTTHLLLIGVGLNLLFTAAHAIFKSPAQSAKIDSIEAKVDGVLNTLTAPKGGNN